MRKKITILHANYLTIIIFYILEIFLLESDSSTFGVNIFDFMNIFLEDASILKNFSIYKNHEKNKY